MIPAEVLRRVVDAALTRGGEFAEVFAEDRRGFNLLLEDRKIERIRCGRDRGAGVRVVDGDVTGYAYTDDLTEAGLFRAAAAASAVVRRSPREHRVELRAGRRRRVAGEVQPPERVSVAQRVALARVADEAARDVDPAVRQVSVQLLHTRQRVRIASSDGLLVGDERHLLQLVVAVTAQRGDCLQVARRTRGGQAGLELLADDVPRVLGREAAQVAVRLLEARPAPAGAMPVIIANGWGGVLFHEAVGHGLEADHIVRNSSIYAGKLGRRVAGPAVTLIDDATIPNHRGSFRVDDEGSGGRRTVLVEEGVLRDYLTDRKAAERLCLPRSGNGRRQSYEHLPLPRMSNLYIAPGGVDPADLVRETKRGLYVASLGGGQVEPASGQFVFTVTEGYLIEGGRLGPPVRGATLAGDASRVLEDIDAVGTDFALDPGIGSCGKGGQWVPVGVGQPTLRVRSLVVGGTA